MIFEDKKKVKHWYAIYTNPRAEKRVLDRLLEQGIDAYLPMITVMRQWSDRKKKVKIPLIKSYVFVNLFEIEIKRALAVFGVVNVLKYMGKPAIVKDFEIDNLKIVTQKGANIESLDNNIGVEIGEDIEIKSGPFEGLKGKCAKIKGKNRVIVELETLGSFFSVEIPVSIVKC